MLLGNMLTSSIIDGHRAALVLRGSGNDPEIAKLIVQKRLAWLDYDAITQRKWQRKTRRIGRGRHHDSRSIREKYVRCVGEMYKLPEVYLGN